MACSARKQIPLKKLQVLRFLTDARIKVMHAWSEVNADLDRLEASFPLHFRLPRSECQHLAPSSSYLETLFHCHWVYPSRPSWSLLYTAQETCDRLGPSEFEGMKSTEYTCRSRSPDVKLKGSQLSVQFKLREGVDVDQLLINLALELGRQDGGLAVQNGQLSMKVCAFRTISIKC